MGTLKQHWTAWYCSLLQENRLGEISEMEYQPQGRGKNSVWKAGPRRAQGAVRRLCLSQAFLASGNQC